MWYVGSMNDQLRAARALRNTIRAMRKKSEEARRLAPQVVEGLISAGLCRLAIPASLGGHETEPKVVLQILEELAGADASPVRPARRERQWSSKTGSGFPDVGHWSPDANSLTGFR